MQSILFYCSCMKIETQLFSTEKHNTFRKPYLTEGRKQQEKSQNKSVKQPSEHEDTENLNIVYYSM